LKCFFWINKYNTQNKKAITNSFQTRFKQTISRMNSSVENTVANTVVVAKAPRTPTLPAKYSKFMAFGYWITSQLVEKTILTEAQRDSVFENLAIFQSLDEQVAFYEGFLKTSCGPSTKAIKKLVAAKNKPPKAPRAKKTKAVAEKQDDLIAKLIADANDGGEGAAVPQEGTTVPQEAAPKKKAAPKKSKKTEPVATLEAATEGAAVAEEPVAPVEAKKKAAPKKSKKTEPVATLEAATEGSTEGSTAVVATAEVVVAEAEPKKKAAPKKSKKTEAATEGDAPVAVTEVVATEPKKKAAPKKSKKTEPVAAPVEPVAAPVEPVATEEGDEDIIQTRVVAIAEKEYLIDSQNNLYTIEEPHDNIGSYDPASGNVSFRPSYTATAAC
jgi:hypothetical protein